MRLVPALLLPPIPHTAPLYPVPVSPSTLFSTTAPLPSLLLTPSPENIPPTRPQIYPPLPLPTLTPEPSDTDFPSFTPRSHLSPHLTTPPITVTLTGALLYGPIVRLALFFPVVDLADEEVS